MKTKSSIKSILSVMIAGILWGCMGLFVRKLNQYGFFTLEITALRSLSSTIAMGIFLALTNPSLLRIKRKDAWCFIGTGIISLTFFNICYFKSITMTSLSVAAVLLYTAPSMVMVLSAFLFHEKLNKRKVLSLFLAFVGCVLVTGVLSDTGSVISPIGILIGLGSGFGYALYSIFARYALNKGYPSLTITFYTLLFSSLGTFYFVSPNKVVNAISDNNTLILYLLCLAIVSTCLPYILYTKGLENMEGGTASIIASMEPVTATVISIVVFHETMSMMGFAGTILVLLSIVIVNIHIKA